MDNLRTRLNRLRAGRERRMDGTYPAEVQPLVDDLNALLDHREQAIQRAIAKSGDLAHGLKTPLAILAQEAERARKAGQHEIAAAIDQQVDRMGRQVDYHLAHARAVASGATGGAQSSVKDSADGLARVLLRLHAERGITVDVQVADDVIVRAQREDLDEMLGNLLDNACKWARATVVVSVVATGARGDGAFSGRPTASRSSWTMMATASCRTCGKRFSREACEPTKPRPAQVLAWPSCASLPSSMADRSVSRRHPRAGCARSSACPARTRRWQVVPCATESLDISQRQDGQE